MRQDLQARGIDKAIFDQAPDSPGAKPWRDLMVNEFGSRLMGDLAREKTGQSVFERARLPSQKALDALLLSQQGSIMQKFGQQLAKTFGVKGPQELSKVLPGLESKP